MDPTLKLILLILLILSLLVAIFFRILRKRFLYQIFELITASIFIGYCSQYAYLFGSIAHLGLNSWCSLLLFVFSIILGIYKALTFRK